MLKAADALHGAGYDVRVVSTRHLDWAWEADQEVRRTRTWSWRVVDYDRQHSRWTYLRTGLRSRLLQRTAKVLGPSRAPLAVAARAYSRVHPELVKAALEEPADLYYGGTTGGLAATAAAARRAGVPYALDLEDFHSGEQDDSPSAGFVHGLAERIERKVLHRAAFLTAGSAAIAEAYEKKYGVRPIAVNNTFPLVSAEPSFSPPDRKELRLYWFSQTIGPQRGLEDAVEAMARADIPGELHVRGRPIPAYWPDFRAWAAGRAPRLAVVQHDPAPPDQMIELARGYDVGLALEQGHVLGRQVCLTNKAFTYMQAGLAVAFTDTPGQRPVAADLGEHAIVYAPGDLEQLTAGLKRWAGDRAVLRRAQEASWRAAKERWHWEHPLERGALLEAVHGVLV
jgi:hypothetical protein